MIRKILFENYKSFKEPQELELKPLTILIGKNSSGKSAVAKLPVLIDNSLNNIVGEPFTIDFHDVQFGGEYRDLFYERIPNNPLTFKMWDDDGGELEVRIVSDFEKNSIPKIIYWHRKDLLELNYLGDGNRYRDLLSGEIYLCSFDGFVLEHVTFESSGNVERVPVSSKLKLQTDYIGPFRVYANSMRTFQLRSFRALPEVGTTGEDAYHILAIEALKGSSELVKSVDKWFKDNFEGWGIKINTDSQPVYKIEMTRDDRRFNVNIADVGQGISQALPLVVNAFLPNPDYLTVIEQPELHLHPAAHGNLAQLFAESAVKFNKRYLIETHSQNFVLRIRRLIAENKFSHHNLAIYYIDYDGVTNSGSLQKINVNEFGEVDFWPENVFSETLDETIAMRTAQVQRKNADRI